MASLAPVVAGAVLIHACARLPTFRSLRAPVVHHILLRSPSAPRRARSLREEPALSEIVPCPVGAYACASVFVACHPPRPRHQKMGNDDDDACVAYGSSRPR